MSRQIPLIVDTDCGVDDAQALILLLHLAQQPDAGFTLLAVTAVVGNTSVQQVTTNIFRVLSVFKQAHPEFIPPPVYAGSASHLLQPVTHAAEYHGLDGLGDTFAASPEPAMPTLQAEHAAVAIGRLVCASPLPVRLLLLGPHTNAALAVRLCPGMVANIESVVFMGGCAHARGNISASAEFNIFSDPEAAAICLSTFPRSTMISWELTLKHDFPWEWMPEWTGRDTVLSKFVSAICARLCETQKSSKLYASFGYLGPDILAAAVAAQPGIVSSSRECYVTVELSGVYTRGMTVVDADGISSHTPNVTIIDSINFELFQAHLVESVK